MRFKIIAFILLFGILSTVAPSTLKAQDAYTTALGIRGGNMIGVSYKRFVWPLSGVLEGVAGFNYFDRLYSFTGLYEYHKFLTYKTNAYGGGGLTFAANKDVFEMRVEAILGLEFMVQWFPINISLDYKPAYSIFKNKFIFDEFGLSIRYILKG